MSDIRSTHGDSSWFTDARFGLFIHWGLYAMAARHEWVQHNEEIPEEAYSKFFRHFDPDLYDPAAWARAASDAGMKYFVITTKHHEGFCLWDTALTDFKAPNTPAGRDLLRPAVDAFRERGLRVGFYHSLIDWHHPQYHIDPYVGPYRNRPDRAEMNKMRDQAKYAEYLHGQVRELLTGFGPVDVLWMDYSFPQRGSEGKGCNDWQSEKLYAMIRQLQPKILLNDRMDLPDAWDIKTPEQTQPAEWVTVNGQRVVWEACQTFSGSWGYHRDESTWRSTDELIRTLIDCVSKGGNLLLNVGPTGRGEFDARAMDRLTGVGQWMRRHGRAIYECTQAPDDIPAPRDCRLTWNPTTRRLYVHVFAWPYKELRLPGLGGRIEYAQLLNDGSQVHQRSDKDWQTAHGGDRAGGANPPAQLVLPLEKPIVAVPVIELFLK